MAREWRRGLLALVIGFSLTGCEAIRGPEFLPTASLVAIELPGPSDAAVPLSRVAPVSAASGQTIRLHAVLVGSENEETVYYTSAARLEIDGQEVDPKTLRPWPNRPIRCLWQTLQVSAPLLEVSSAEQLEQLRFTNFSHPDWGVACSAIATVTARQRETMTVPDDARRLAFGQQNYQVWVEILERETSLVSEQSFKSPASAALLADATDFPRVSVQLDGRLAIAAGVFGLSQIEPKPTADESVRQRIAELHEQRLLFSRELLFKELVTEAGSGPIDWRLIEINGEHPFSSEGGPVSGAAEAARVGDLLRVGDRFVVLFRDVGAAGVLDGEDLCFDYTRGAIVRRLRDVFVGEGDGDVEWAAR